MKIDTFALQKELSASGVSVTDRASFLAVGVARGLAWRLPLPHEAIADPRAFFAQECLEISRQVVCQVNETCVIDIDAVMELTYQLWFFRYQVCHIGCREEAIAGIVDAISNRTTGLEAYHELTHRPSVEKFIALAGVVVGRAFKE